MAWVIIDKRVAANPPSQKEVQQVIDYLARRAKARFYSDENFPAQAVHLLRQIGAKVKTAQEAGLISHPDENQLAYARRNGLIFLTCDRDFLDNRRFPLIHCPAIFVLDFGSGSAREMRQTFRCLSGALQMPQFFDKWWKVDAKRDGWTELVRYQDGSTSRHRMRLFRGKLYEWIDD
jgi:predicted nuclease of predicted toxin-antitoxin system